MYIYILIAIAMFVALLIVAINFVVFFVREIRFRKRVEKLLGTWDKLVELGYTNVQEVG